jgi:hydrogenase maturation protein HypF
VDLALSYRDHHGCKAVGLTGGVFQNNLLTLEIQQRLQGTGVDVLIPERLPLNDAGLSFGQVVEAQSIQREKMAVE